MSVYRKSNYKSLLPWCKYFRLQIIITLPSLIVGGLNCSFRIFDGPFSIFKSHFIIEKNSLLEAKINAMMVNWRKLGVPQDQELKSHYENIRGLN